MQQSW